MTEGVGVGESMRIEASGTDRTGPLGADSLYSDLRSSFGFDLLPSTGGVYHFETDSDDRRIGDPSAPDRRLLTNPDE